jgi:hypothetical protein
MAASSLAPRTRMRCERWMLGLREPFFYERCCGPTPISCPGTAN